MNTIDLIKKVESKLAEILEDFWQSGDFILQQDVPHDTKKNYLKYRRDELRGKMDATIEIYAEIYNDGDTTPLRNVWNKHTNELVTAYAQYIEKITNQEFEK